MSEKRKNIRFVEKNDAVIIYSIEKDNSNRDSESVRTKDLSIAGAKLLSHKFFPVDTRLLLSMQLHNSKQIMELWAKVVCVQNLNKKGEYEVGVKFIHSMQTMSNLFQHLYGNKVQQIGDMSNRKDSFFPIDVA
ncbi:PilZ domain-containing protein [Acidobacteriota bacterium]